MNIRYLLHYNESFHEDYVSLFFIYTSQYGNRCNYYIQRVSVLDITIISKNDRMKQKISAKEVNYAFTSILFKS